MLRINRQTDYALRIILYLAKEPAGTRISSTEIREEMLIPKALAPRIVAELAHAEFITTYPGRDGGIELSRDPENVSMWDIINLFEGPIYLSECLVHGQECPFEDECPVRQRWNPLYDVIRREMESVTFADLTRDAKMLQAFSFEGTG
jgi:Rrf2 family protein